MKFRKDEALLQRCLDSWYSLSDFREGRNRHKSFAYGRQWEGERAESSGRRLTNNLIRQMLKGIIGRWRYLRNDEGWHSIVSSSKNEILDRDSRALEEFLISGCALQKIEKRSGEVRISNVSPERLILGSISEPDASDASLIGLLHDMDLHELIRRFSGGDAEKALILSRLPMEDGNQFSYSEGERINFHTSSRRGRVRIIEVWEKETRLELLVHDRDNGEYLRLPGLGEINRLLLTLDRHRRRKGKEGLTMRMRVGTTMRRSFLTAGGMVLESELQGEDSPVSIVVRFYPFIDGEIHSLVEDVIGQQQCVNRLVSLLDGILDSSAKGVLLFPTDQLPEGFTWSDMRRIWESPGGILPYKRTSKNVAPKQIYSTGSSSGATDMLNLQLKLFDEISGMTSGMRGRSGTTGAEAMRLEMENSTVGMLDLLGSFEMFTKRRDTIAEKLL